MGGQIRWPYFCVSGIPSLCSLITEMNVVVYCAQLANILIYWACSKVRGVPLLLGAAHPGAGHPRLSKSGPAIYIMQ